MKAYKHEMFAVFTDHQIHCPNCESANIDWQKDEFVDGGGNHNGPALHFWCEDCEYEWMEPI